MQFAVVPPLPAKVREGNGCGVRIFALSCTLLFSTSLLRPSSSASGSLYFQPVAVGAQPVPELTAAAPPAIRPRAAPA